MSDAVISKSRNEIFTQKTSETEEILDQENKMEEKENSKRPFVFKEKVTQNFHSMNEFNKRDSLFNSFE